MVVVVLARPGPLGGVSPGHLVLDTAQHLPPLRLAQSLRRLSGLAEELLAARTARRGLVVVVTTEEVPAHHDCWNRWGQNRSELPHLSD